MQRGQALQSSIVPRPVYCPTRHLHTSREIADDARAGRFTNAGLTLELGLDPDWLGAGLPADEEWGLEWRQFYFGLDLAHAFGETGDRGYLDAWERLVESWIERVPVDADPSEVLARRVQNWLYAWRVFAESPTFDGLGDGLDERIVASVAEQAEWLRANLTPARNHRTLELYALLVIALALPELDPGTELCAFALAQLDRNLADDFRPDGVHVEQSTHYHCIVLRSFVAARENMRRFGLDPPDGFDERLARAREFAWHCRRPDGSIPMLSDADGGSYGELLELAGELLGRPAPRETNVSFPDGGYYVQRSGWDADARFLILDCGPLGEGGHGHYDLLSLEAVAGDRALVIDPGRYTYSGEGAENARHWFKGTAAHNTVCVDGLDQTPYRRGKPKGPVAEGRLVERVTRDGLDVIHAEARSPCYEVVHERRVSFVGGEHWVVTDVLRAEESHRYDLRWHLAPEAWGEVSVSGSTVHAPGLELVVLPECELRIEPGWVAPAYGVRERAPVVSAVQERAHGARFVTRIVPVEGG